MFESSVDTFLAHFATTQKVNSLKLAQQPQEGGTVLEEKSVGKTKFLSMSTYILKQKPKQPKLEK